MNEVSHDGHTSFRVKFRCKKIQKVSALKVSVTSSAFFLKSNQQDRDIYCFITEHTRVTGDGHTHIVHTTDTHSGPRTKSRFSSATRAAHIRLFFLCPRMAVRIRRRDKELAYSWLLLHGAKLSVNRCSRKVTDGGRWERLREVSEIARFFISTEKRIFKRIVATCNR